MRRLELLVLAEHPSGCIIGDWTISRISEQGDGLYLCCTNKHFALARSTMNELHAIGKSFNFFEPVHTGYTTSNIQYMVEDGQRVGGDFHVSSVHSQWLLSTVLR